MEYSSEQIVTKLLSNASIISRPPRIRTLVSNPAFNLGNFLKSVKPKPNPYEGKYVFIKG